MKKKIIYSIKRISSEWWTANGLISTKEWWLMPRWISTDKVGNSPGSKKTDCKE